MTPLVTCEHGGNRIPVRYRHLFAGAGSILAGHRGWDPGALDAARALARRLGAALFYSTTSRLLVDLNRSPHHRQLYSSWTRDCDAATREEILAHYYHPHRERVESMIRKTRGPVLHFSIHSFTPVLDGKPRNADIGLLYDPSRTPERRLCLELQARLRQHGLVVRRNYPYRGNADGFTTHLRQRFGARRYLGIEIEINQCHAAAGKSGWRVLRGRVVESVSRLCLRAG